jgi:hypothetical protein
MVKAMAQVLKFQDAFEDSARSARSEVASRNRQAEDEEYSFWPEVECGLWRRNRTVAPDPSKSAGRVFGEVAVILGVASLLVLLVTVFIGGPP